MVVTRKGNEKIIVDYTTGSNCQDHEQYNTQQTTQQQHNKPNEAATKTETSLTAPMKYGVHNDDDDDDSCNYDEGREIL